MKEVLGRGNARPSACIPRKDVGIRTRDDGLNIALQGFKIVNVVTRVSNVYFVGYVRGHFCGDMSVLQLIVSIQGRRITSWNGVQVIGSTTCTELHRVVACCLVVVLS